MDNKHMLVVFFLCSLCTISASHCVYKEIRNVSSLTCFNVTSDMLLDIDEEFIPKIEYLKIEANSKVETLRANTSLSKFINLKSLILSSIKIQEIQPKAFVGLEKLEVLIISYNPLTSVSEDVFSDLIKLKTFVFLKNSLKDFKFNLSQSALENVDLKFNNLTEFDFGYLPPTVKDVDLSNNQLVNVKNHKLAKSLSRLLLDNNKIKNFKSVPKSDDYPNMEWLDLSFNEIESASCFGYKNVVFVSLHYNKISVIKENSFANCNRMLVLLLSHNEIISIEPNAFKGAVYLAYLSLNLNKLKKLNPDSFQGLINLYMLNLEANQLDSINVEKLMKKTTKLEHLQIVGNPFSCDGIEEIVKGGEKHKLEISIRNDIFVSNCSRF